MHSVVSYPDRGPWGSSTWRGNASGHLYKDLFEQLRPAVFVDPMVGSGTSVEVAREMGIEAYGLDLHSGFDALRMSILQAVGKPAELVVSHPPYGGMVLYSGHVWGSAPHPNDLSHCVDDADFCEKLQAVMLNQREATRDGGYYGTLIGDWRRQGRYTSYQAEVIARMPSDELAAVIIKQQHNCMSDQRTYSRMQLPRILHEYLVLFRKRSVPVLVMLADLARTQQQRLSGVWRNIVRSVLLRLGGQANLQDLYKAIAESAPEKLATNPNWEAKVRQVLNSTPALFVSKERGVWACASN